MISCRTKVLICRSISRSVLLAKDSEVVSKMAEARTSCSAWLIRSAAKKEASAVESATMRISLGPATISISTTPYSSFLAVATKILPGPTILSTLGIRWVP